jgi:hypothetical protein
MTVLMEEAIKRLQAVPANEQDRLARFVLNELQQDERWAASTEANADRVQKLISDVLADDAAGKCEPLDPDQL